MFELHIFQIFILAVFKGDIYVHLQCCIGSRILNATELSISHLVLVILYIWAWNLFLQETDFVFPMVVHALLF